MVATNAYERAQEPIQIFKGIDHQMGHEGRIFVSDVDYGSSVGVAISNVLIRTNRAAVHLRKIVGFNSTGTLTLKVFENPTLNSDGTGNPVRCSNRVPGETGINVAHVFSGAVASSNGTLLTTHFNFGKADSGDLQNEGVPEWILAPNSNYMISVEHSGASASVALSIAWYEWEH